MADEKIAQFDAKAKADADAKADASSKALADANTEIDALKKKLAAAEEKTVTVSGGAQSQVVQVEVNQPAETEENTIPVITTALGSFGMLGIAAIGSTANVTLQAFSDQWMRPATKAGAKALKKYREARDAKR